MNQSTNDSRKKLPVEYQCKDQLSLPPTAPYYCHWKRANYTASWSLYNSKTPSGYYCPEPPTYEKAVEEYCLFPCKIPGTPLGSTTQGGQVSASYASYCLQGGTLHLVEAHTWGMAGAPGNLLGYSKGDPSFTFSFYAAHGNLWQGIFQLKLGQITPIVGDGDGLPQDLVAYSDSHPGFSAELKGIVFIAAESAA
jgi:hypothetical protein